MGRQFFRVIVRGEKLKDYDAYEEAEFYPVYAESANAAANSVVIQKKVKKENVIAVRYETMY